MTTPTNSSRRPDWQDIDRRALGPPPVLPQVPGMPLLFDPLAPSSSNNKPLTADDEALLEVKAKLTARILKAIYTARQSPIGVWRIVYKSDEGGPPHITWFHKEWQDLALRNRFAMIEAPRESCKTAFALSLLLWFMGRRPDWRWRLLCEDDSASRKRLAFVRTAINTNEYLRLAFPQLREDEEQRNDKSVLNIQRESNLVDPSLEACGVLSAGVGSRCEGMILDDICSYRNTLGQPALREEVKRQMREAWLPTLITKGGRLLDIFTPWHEEDFNSEAKKAGRWAYKRYYHGKPGNPYHSAFEAKISEDDLKARRIDLGATGYARAYLCRTLTKDSVLITPEHLRPYTPGSELTAQMLNDCQIIISLDPAKGEGLAKGKDPDFHGITIVLLHQAQASLAITQGEARQGKARQGTGAGAVPPFQMFIADAYQTRIPDTWLLYHLIDLCRDWRARWLLIESQGMQSLGSWLQDVAQDLPTIVPVTVGNMGKGQRLQRITPLLEVPEGTHPRVLFHPSTVAKLAPVHPLHITHRDGGTYTGEAVRNLRHQLLNFPTKHDDTADSFTQGIWWTYENLAPRGGPPRGQLQVEAKTISFSSKAA